MKKTPCMIIILMITVQYVHAMDSAQQLATLEVSLKVLHKRLPPPSKFTSEQIEQAKKILEKTPDALHDAVISNNLSKIALLLDAGADINKRDGKYGATPLHYAAYAGRIEITRLLIEKGAQVNIADNEGKISLHSAVLNGRIPLLPAVLKAYLETMRLLIEKGADINKADNAGETPLHKAAEKGHTRRAQLLIEKGAHVNLKNHKGETPLDLAHQRRRVDIERLLLKRGAQFGKPHRKRR